MGYHGKHCENERYQKAAAEKNAVAKSRVAPMVSVVVLGVGKNVPSCVRV